MANDPSAFFRDMLGQWEKAANQFGADAMKSEEFARVMGSATAATASGQAAMQQQMEKAFAAANLPTKRDLDDLSTRMAKIEASLARIEAVLGATPPAPGKSKPSRGRKPPKAAA